MCLEISNNLLLVLQDAPKRIFFYELAILWSAKKRRKDTLFSPSIPFPQYFLQLQQYWHLYCFAILVSTSTVIHSVKQRLLRNRPGSALRPLATSLLKDYKAHSLQQTSFAESPSTSHRQRGVRLLLLVAGAVLACFIVLLQSLFQLVFAFYGVLCGNCN